MNDHIETEINRVAKTHPDAIWVRANHLDFARKFKWCTSACVTSDLDEYAADEIEFVPVSAYLELKTQLDAAQYSANGFESLYDAAHAELSKLKVAFEKERDELLERLEPYEAEQFARVCPGCQAVAPERCAPGCIDDEMARERDDALTFGAREEEEDDDYSYYNDNDDGDE